MTEFKNDPALDFLLMGIDDQDQKESITKAFYSFRGGDPDTFPVQFAVLVKASALCQLKVTEKMRKVAESTGDGAVIERIEKLEERVGEIPREVSKVLPTSRALKDVAESLKIQISNFPKPNSATDRKGEGSSAKTGSLVLTFFVFLNLLATSAIGYFLFQQWSR